MKSKKISLFGALFLVISIIALGFSTNSNAKDQLKVWTNTCGGDFQNGQIINLYTNDEEAKIFWTIFPNGSPTTGNVYEGPFKISRSTVLYFFAFTDEQNATKYEICRFNVESAEETNYLKILKINPQDKKVYIKNWSKFDTNLKDWKVTSLSNEILLPNEQLKPNEVFEIDLKMRRVLGEIRLISPKNITKDKVVFPRLKDNEIWQKANDKDVFSPFNKTKIAEN